MVENIEKRIGIIGGGQLGKMMILEAKKMGFYIIILDPTKNCPAHSISDEHIIADFDDKKAIKLLAEKADVITYEFEHINTEALKELEENGKKVYPTAKSLEIIQNKLLQKKLLKENKIPVPDFMEIKTFEDINNAAEVYNYPFMLKSCTGGYDGKGNFLIKNSNQLKQGYEELGQGTIPLMAEKFFPFIKEISVLACRGIDGDIKVYPVAENIHVDSILFETRVPADISKETSSDAMKLAENVMQIFEGVGMFCVEMFVDKDGNTAVNEVAPRPHNSGHYSIEGCYTSQFEQHIRAVSGLPLGSSDLIMPTVMINILGETEGKAHVIGAESVIAIEGVYLHIYGKEISKPKRKMGHITAIAPVITEAVEKAEKAKEFIKILGK